MRYISTQGYPDIDIKQDIPEEFKHFEHCKVKDEVWHLKIWKFFIDELSKLSIEYWAESYSDNDILDGTQWELEIEFNGVEKMVRGGSNAYPPAWKKFIRVIRKYVDGDIE